MTKPAYLSAIVMVTVLALAVLLNPSPERHRAKIKEITAERSPLAGALGVGSLKAFTSTYHSMGVASYTTAGERTLSVGLFGMVLVLE
jgi:hypothetical protein